jgi:hypothetical protein
MAAEEEVKPNPTAVPEGTKQPVVSKPAPKPKATRAAKTAKPKVDKESGEYVQPEWSITVSEVVGTERVEIKPFGWVGPAAIVTSVEKAHNLGKLLADVKHLTDKDEGENLVVK